MEIRSTRARMCIAIAALAAMLVAVGVSVQDAKPADAAPVSTNIVGGTETPNGKYPFVTALLDNNISGGAYYQQFCGGSLIDSDSILTAAHCVVGTNPRSISVVVGRTVLSENQGQKRSVSAVYVHPRYIGGNDSAYDAAVLDLGSPVSGIAPVRLATSSQDALETPGRYATVAGWGNTVRQSPDGHEQDTYADRMREVQVPLVSDSSARNSYGNSYYSALMVAAGTSGKDSCQGDSGGPMFTSVSGTYTQIGVVSFGAGCGYPGYPGVYSEVNNSSIYSFVTNAAAS